ncbi:tyrosine-type recombinase/integrase [Haematobacter genomosp. 1]|uniref:Tyr recombinase domain-containing protein n=1 Tax=Haematobacter genomosp. 1 TaxID=366618 RepID=A0A212ACQ8_9RHOB|nr:tyrosine-type recombinase/integrase [Haematobacter genomosp. 1]OWJ78545.1 hypothetical protein CDV49_08985 [Haematobacter genomosp. 1]
MKKKPEFPGAKPYNDRHGKRRWRFRAKGGFQRELGTSYGCPDFISRYEAAVKEHETGKKGGVAADRTIPGSLNDLIASWYRSPDFRNLADVTKRLYRGQVEPLRVKHGNKPSALMERRHIMKILAEKVDTPVAANHLRKRLIQLLDHAVALEWRKDNPARLVKPYRVASEGIHTWDEGEIARFYEVHKDGTVAHRAMVLMLYTGAARVDAVKLGWANIKPTEDGYRLLYRRQKTVKTNGEMVNIPIHPDLWAVIEPLPKDRPFLVTAYGKSRSPTGLGKRLRAWCDEANLSECSSHGLRKACARRLAEAGATANEIMSVTGHKTLSEVQRYTAAAMREELADAAMQKLISRPNREQTVVNLPHRFAKNNDNNMKIKDK